MLEATKFVLVLLSGLLVLRLLAPSPAGGKIVWRLPLGTIAALLIFVAAVLPA